MRPVPGTRESETTVRGVWNPLEGPLGTDGRFGLSAHVSLVPEAEAGIPLGLHSTNHTGRFRAFIDVITPGELEPFTLRTRIGIPRTAL